MSTLSLLTGWAVGTLNGYKEGGLPNSIKYGTMGLVGGAHFINIIKHQAIKPVTPGQFLAAILIGPPIVSGFVFCLGHHFGKAIGYVSGSNTKAIEGAIKLL